MNLIRNIFSILLICILNSMIFPQSGQSLNEQLDAEEYLNIITKNKLPNWNSSSLGTQILETHYIIDSVVTRDQIAYFSYDADGKILSIRIIADFFNGWENYSRITYSYNMYGRIISINRDGWYLNQWQSVFKTIYIYDDSNRISNLYSQKREWGMDKWEYTTKTNYEYDNSSRVLVKGDYYWMEYGWEIREINNYTYSADGLLISDVKTYPTQKLQVNYSYDSTFKKIEERTLLEKSGQWNNHYFKTFNYNSENMLISSIGQAWDNSNWKNDWQINYEYNNANNLINKTGLIWQDQSWINFHRYAMTYDDENRLKTKCYKIWYDNPGVWSLQGYPLIFSDSFGQEFNFYADSLTISYKTITDVKEDIHNPKDFSLSQNYPNPFNPATVIRYSISVAAPSNAEGQKHVSLKVYDILGNEVATLVDEYKQAGNYEVEFNGAYLASGIYFYRLVSGKFSVTKKMILMK